MTLLRINGLVVGYGGVPVLHGVDVDVDEGQLVTVIGANGAGKSTLMRTIAGLERPMSGTISFDGVDISRASPRRVTGLGVAHVPENRRVFSTHSIEENLLLGAYARGRDRRAIAADLEGMYEQFPILKDRRTLPAGTLSGGEQQMLAIAMALMARPRLLMLDEPSLGLAPMVVRKVFDEIAALRRNGTTILLNEQLANRALAIADHGLVLHLGRVVTSGAAGKLRTDDAVRSAYLGA